MTSGPPYPSLLSPLHATHVYLQVKDSPEQAVPASSVPSPRSTATFTWETSLCLHRESGHLQVLVFLQPLPGIESISALLQMVKLRPRKGR